MSSPASNSLARALLFFFLSLVMSLVMHLLPSCFLYSSIPLATRLWRQQVLLPAGLVKCLRGMRKAQLLASCRVCDHDRCSIAIASQISIGKPNGSCGIG